MVEASPQIYNYLFISGELCSDTLYGPIKSLLREEIISVNNVSRSISTAHVTARNQISVLFNEISISFNKTKSFVCTLYTTFIVNFHFIDRFITAQ